MAISHVLEILFAVQTIIMNLEKAGSNLSLERISDPSLFLLISSFELFYFAFAK